MKSVTFFFLFTIIFLSCSKTEPTACITARDIAFAQGGQEFKSCSSDADDFIWNFGDGNTESGPVVVHVYDSVGEFNVTLEAKGEDGTDRVSHTIKLVYKVVDSIKINRVADPFSKVTAHMLCDGFRSAETMNLTTTSFPVTYTFPNSEAVIKSNNYLFKLVSDVTFREWVGDEVINNDYSNPTIINGAQLDVELYWHYSE